MHGALFVSALPITSLLNQCLVRVEDSILHEINRGAIDSGDSRAGNVCGGSRAWQRSGTQISMSSSSATQLDPVVKVNLMSKRTGLSRNKCLARYDGAFLHFVTTSERTICRNFFNSCCKGCERAESMKNLDQHAAKQGGFQRKLWISRSLSNRRHKEHNCDLHRKKFVCRSAGRVLKERSITSAMHLRVCWPSDIVERVEGWRPKATDENTHRHGKQVFRGIWRDDKHGKPIVTMSVDDADSTKLIKLIKTSELENSKSTFRAIKRYIFSQSGILRRNSRIMNLNTARKRSCL